MFTTCFPYVFNMFFNVTNLKCYPLVEVVKQRAVEHFKVVMSEIIPILDEVVGPVLKCGKLARSQIPKLVFDVRTLKPQHKVFPMYNDVKDLEALGNLGNLGPFFSSFSTKSQSGVS